MNELTEQTRSLLLKLRKGSTAQFETKQWTAVLEALGFTVRITKERNTVVTFEATKGQGPTVVIHKEPRYRRIVFYDLMRNLKAQGHDLPAMACEALGMDTPDVEKHKKAIARGANDLHRTGTCQCCFNPQKVSKGDGKLMSLHGYQRPGIGYIIGDCMGQGEQPFEVSCEITKKMRTWIQERKARTEEYLARLKAGEVEELEAEIVTNEKERDSYGYNRLKHVRVKVAKGAPQTQNPYFPDEPWQRVPSFGELLEKEIYAVNRRIGQMERDINFLTEKIDTWVKVWEE